MSVITGNGLNVLTDNTKKQENQPVENLQEVKQTEIILRHEITIRLDIDHLLNQIEKNEDKINKLLSYSEIEKEFNPQV